VAAEDTVTLVKEASMRESTKVGGALALALCALGFESRAESLMSTVIGLIALPLWIAAIVLGVKAARRKGISPHWMWFGIHPLGAMIACPIIMWGVKARVCAKCGTPVPKGFTYCSSCHASLFPHVISPPPCIPPANERGTAKLVLRFYRHPLDFFQYLGIPWTKAIARMDGGQQFEVPWREDTVWEVPSGRHQIEIAAELPPVLYNVNKATTCFDALDGQTIRVEYTVPATIFQAGIIAVIHRPLHGGRSARSPSIVSACTSHLLSPLTLGILPLLIWLGNRKHDKFAAFHAKQSLAWFWVIYAASVCLMMAIAGVLIIFPPAIMPMGDPGSTGRAALGYFFLSAVALALVAYPVFAVFRVGQGKPFKYPLVANGFCAKEFAEAYPTVLPGAAEPMPLSSPSAIASLLLGVASILLCFLTGIPSIICGILALVYARKARQKVDSDQPGQLFVVRMVSVGKACGFAGMALGSLCFIAFIATLFLRVLVR
jgi:uncharacterized Tic20 family protein